MQPYNMKRVFAEVRSEAGKGVSVQVDNLRNVEVRFADAPEGAAKPLLLVLTDPESGVCVSAPLAQHEEWQIRDFRISFSDCDAGTQTARALGLRWKNVDSRGRLDSGHEASFTGKLEGHGKTIERFESSWASTWWGFIPIDA